MQRAAVTANYQIQISRTAIILSAGRKCTTALEDTVKLQPPLQPTGILPYISLSSYTDFARPRIFGLLKACIGIIAVAAAYLSIQTSSQQNSVSTKPFANRLPRIRMKKVLLLACIIGCVERLAKPALAQINTGTLSPPSYVPYQVFTMTFCGFNYSTYNGGAFNRSLLQLRWADFKPFFLQYIFLLILHQQI